MKSANDQQLIECAISAAKYYMGVPDGKFFSKDKFGEEVVNASNAYVTLNTLMGNETAELARYLEGKKHVVGLLTQAGVSQMLLLHQKLAYLAVMLSNIKEPFECVRVCSQSEIRLGETFARMLTSTTKLSIEEIMQMEYGNESELAVCKYKIHPGAVVLDMEQLGEHYLKQEEREVLIIIGNKLVSRFCGYEACYIGKSGKPAAVYEIEVYSPNIPVFESDEQSVFDEQTLAEVREFYEELNTHSEFPQIPSCYSQWKKSFQSMVYANLANTYKQLGVNSV